MTNTRLSVNLNKIALVRNARGQGVPQLAEFARLAVTHGAVGVTIHPRPDQRHARYSDIAELRQCMGAEFELNVEGYPAPELMSHVLAQRPDQLTFVPDAPHQITSDHGWNLKQPPEVLLDALAAAQSAGIRVSVFLDPELAQIERAAELGFDRIELYTEAYAKAFAAGQYQPLLAQYQACIERARTLELGVNAGHDLDLENLSALVACGGIAEVSIGHALTVEAWRYGFAETIQRYVALLAAAAR
jgi:pyridoxine 5-phosphate synthase